MERRKYHRLIGPFNGTWRAASGEGVCQIRDISLSGCFVESASTPRPGEDLTITIDLNGEELLVPAGKVVYLESATSFSTAFRPTTDDERAALAEQINRLVLHRSTDESKRDTEPVPAPYHQDR